MEAIDLAAMLNGVLRLAGASDRSDSSLLSVILRWNNVIIEECVEE